MMAARRTGVRAEAAAGKSGAAPPGSGSRPGHAKEHDQSFAWSGFSPVGRRACAEAYHLRMVEHNKSHEGQDDHEDQELRGTGLAAGEISLPDRVFHGLGISQEWDFGPGPYTPMGRYRPGRPRKA